MPGAELIEADVRNESILERALGGCDAVISALGTGIGFRKVSRLDIALRHACDPEQLQSRS
jgi:hypothetical protein